MMKFVQDISIMIPTMITVLTTVGVLNCTVNSPCSDVDGMMKTDVLITPFMSTRLAC